MTRTTFSGELYAFTNKQRNKIKCVFWEDNGFVLYYKALAEDKFKWPKCPDELVTLTGQQLNWFLDGYDINLMKPHKKLQFSRFLATKTACLDTTSPLEIMR
ncbi:IS66 family insertion sequence element accessory protein TnpB [Motilimonas cestriensis]|uniref:IS66 family insertion sequence element accessory protein TnpB n=1 Tax=Motilimonas cestriensis TaxID=2742685 RepID=A0ABS8WDK4_9GAMM|nr:IS66 family insertion sequence element accessory protein TnpB [Motilimonas cestriensis]MCE2596348.1 IS66 family insertion sequence element accessory protein TnpB [Motilimonas cestriensis]